MLSYLRLFLLPLLLSFFRSLLLPFSLASVLAAPWTRSLDSPPGLDPWLVFAEDYALHLFDLSLELLVGVHHVGYGLAAVKHCGVVAAAY